MPVKPRISKQRELEIAGMEEFLRDGDWRKHPQIRERVFDTRFWREEIPAAFERLRGQRPRGFFKWAEEEFRHG